MKIILRRLSDLIKPYIPKLYLITFLLTKLKRSNNY